MMMNAQKRDPQLVAQIQDMIESGMEAQKIAETLMAQAEIEKEGVSMEKEVECECFPDEIIIASQALAYRDATIDDAQTILRIINLAYETEVRGKEAFRDGPGTITENLVIELLNSRDYQWLLLEVPRGMHIEKDGTVLGVCCYSTHGVSRRNGEIEGKLGTIRFFAVTPRYHGVLLGHRFLKKVEDVLSAASCCRVMACIPDCRERLLDWLLHSDRGYDIISTTQYPQILPGHTLLQSKKSTSLLMLSKPLQSRKIMKSNEIEKISQGTVSDASKGNDRVNHDQQIDTASANKVLPTPSARNYHLPPHWRGAVGNSSSGSNL